MFLLVLSLESADSFYIQKISVDLSEIQCYHNLLVGLTTQCFSMHKSQPALSAHLLDYRTLPALYFPFPHAVILYFTAAALTTKIFPPHYV